LVGYGPETSPAHSCKPSALASPRNRPSSPPPTAYIGLVAFGPGALSACHPVLAPRALPYFGFLGPTSSTWHPPCGQFVRFCPGLPGGRALKLVPPRLSPALDRLPAARCRLPACGRSLAVRPPRSATLPARRTLRTRPAAAPLRRATPMTRDEVGTRSV